MALVGNGVRMSASNPMRQMGVNTAGVVNRGGWAMSGAMRNVESGWHSVSGVTSREGIPGGVSHPVAWLLPQKGGSMASRFEISGAGTVSNANLAGGLNAEASLSGSGDITSADMRLLIYATATLSGLGLLTADIVGSLQLDATISGTGTISSASLASVLNAAATLSGSCSLSADIAGALSASASLAGSGQLSADIAGAVLAVATLAGSCGVSADVIGAWFMESTLTGSGSINAAAIAGIAEAVSTILGTGSVSSADLRGIGSLSATVSVSTSDPLSPQALAAAVWNAVAASYQSPGTMGEAMSTAGAGGLSPTQATMLLELYQLAGLDPTKPLVVTETARKVPADGSDIDQTIEESSGTVTVTRQ